MLILYCFQKSDGIKKQLDFDREETSQRVKHAPATDEVSADLLAVSFILFTAVQLCLN